MNRREFTKSLTVAASLPALPFPAAAASKAPPTAGSLRWAAVYLSNLQGKFTPQMVRQITGVSERAAHQLTQQLIAEKLITPAHAAGRVAIGSPYALPKTKMAKTTPQMSDLKEPKAKLERLSKHFDEMTAADAPQDTEQTKDTNDE